MLLSPRPEIPKYLLKVQLTKGHTLEGFGNTFVYAAQVYRFNSSDS